MSKINFFAHNIKPRKLEGTGMLNPANTSVISENVRCIRQWDVNIWFYTKNGTTIAFDSGYETFPNLEGEFVKIGVDPKLIKTVLITHADMDHAGGISDKGTRIFPNACVYIHENEEDMLLGKEERFVFGPLKIKNPIVYSGRYCCLKDGETIYIEGIKIQVFHVPGHTPGHASYLVDDKVLITGDSLAINNNGGYAFLDFFNMNSKQLRQSLMEFKNRIKEVDIELVCTGHSGYTRDFKSIFKYIDEHGIGTKRAPFDDRAPQNAFK